MDLPTINGRECVPVRLLPFMTRRQTLPPDNLANILSWRHPFADKRWAKETYQLLPGGAFRPLQPPDWDATVAKISDLTERFKRQASLAAECEWDMRSIEALPAGVFVWRDDLEHEYARMFGDQLFYVERPGVPDVTDEQYQAALDNIIDPFPQLDATPDSDQAASLFDELAEAAADGLMTRPGDGKLSFDPLLSSAEYRLVLEGFEALMKVTKGNQSKLTQEQKASIVERMSKGEKVAVLARDFGVSRRTIDACKPVAKSLTLDTAWGPSKKGHKTR